MRVVVPFDAVEPKTRLDPVLDADERAVLAVRMLRDVLDSLRKAGLEPEVLANAPVEVDAPTILDERPLTPAVNAILDGTDGPVAVVMADLALATPAAVERLVRTDGEVVLVPGRGGGTNAIVARHPAFRVDYHGASFRDHREAARAVGVTAASVDSFRLSTDVDEPVDLAELLLHGEGRAADWLRDAGVRLSVGETGRVGAEREG